MTGRLGGKVVLISGGARGQGEAEARLFVAEGARVVLGDVLDEPGEKVASELGEAAVYTRLDVTAEPEWQAAVALTQRRYGRLDVLVNNAGILRHGPLETTPAEEFRSVVDVNQTGCFLGMKSAIPAMRAAGGGSIINISSAAGLEGVSGVIAYSASKWAVRGMTKCAALELGGAGIRVNSVHPGGVDTEMVAPGRVGSVDRGEIFGAQPIPRIGQPEEIARMVLFLASDESSYCTGGEFIVDGGSTAGRVVRGLEDSD